MRLHVRQWLLKELENDNTLMVVKGGVRIYTSRVDGFYELYSEYGYHYGLELEEAFHGFLEDIKKCFLVSEEEAIDMIQVKS